MFSPKSIAFPTITATIAQLIDRVITPSLQLVQLKITGMKHDKVVWLIVSAAPVVAAFGFSSCRPSIATFRPSTIGEANARRFMFGGGGGSPLDMISSLFSSKLSPDTSNVVNQGLAALSVDNWATVRSHLESKMTTEYELNFRANLEKGYGVASPSHKIRLFDKSNDEQDIRVVFYRDSASTYDHDHRSLVGWYVSQPTSLTIFILCDFLYVRLVSSEL